MLLKKILHLKTKIKSHISNIDLLEIVIEDNNAIRKDLSELNDAVKHKNDQIENLNKRVVALEKLNIAYSKDVLLLSQAIAEQYEVLATIVNRELLLHTDDLLDLDLDFKKKKKKIVH